MCVCARMCVYVCVCVRARRTAYIMLVLYPGNRLAYHIAPEGVRACVRVCLACTVTVLIVCPVACRLLLPACRLPACRLPPAACCLLPGVCRLPPAACLVVSFCCFSVSCLLAFAQR